MPAAVPVPPNELATFVGGPEYAAIGRMFRDRFIELGGLKPGERVLDVGCGSGRMAGPLTEYLGPTATYEGFDIVGPAVEWCRREITARHPNFRFRHADIFNGFYNPAGRTRSFCFRFPYPGGSFDFTLLTSVFTHMMPDDMQHYLGEVSRTLAVGGRCFATFFLLNAETAALLRAGRGSLRLPYTFGQDGKRPPGRPAAYGDCFLEQSNEGAVAYEERWVRDLFARCGFELRSPVRYGHWSGREGAPDFQDLIVATKVRGVTPGFRLRRALRLGRVRQALWRLRRAA
jgi:SAM-dependent methyltransferase